MLCNTFCELREGAVTCGRIEVESVASDYAGIDQRRSLEHACKDVCKADDGQACQVESGPTWG